MQITIYYSAADQYLIDRVDADAHRSRRSRSAVIFSILERHYERGKQLGEILVDMGKITPEDVERMRRRQKQGSRGQRFGDLLLEEGLITKKDLYRALAIQEPQETK